MPTLLFVNACIRGPQHSRTYLLCRAFLEQFALHHPDWTLDTVDLNELDLRPFNAKRLAERDRQIEQGVLDNDYFALAWQFAAADKILVGAPYWDLSFPAALKTYIEHVSVGGITIKFENNRLSGLCAADSLMYLATVGGALEQADLGYDYFRGLCRQFDIPVCKKVDVETLDLDGVDPGALLDDALRRARQAADEF